MFFDELSNDEWALLAALVSDEPAVRLNRRGRPRAEPRIVANAVLWILTTGEPWSKLPGRYPSGPTCRRRFEEWQLNGTLLEMVRLLSHTGRTFAYIPQPAPPVAAKPAAAETPVPVARDEAVRGVSWRSPESWQAPGQSNGSGYVSAQVSGALGALGAWRAADPIADITRQLSGLAQAEQRVEYSLQPQATAPREPGGIAQAGAGWAAHQPAWRDRRGDPRPESLHGDMHTETREQAAHGGATEPAETTEAASDAYDAQRSPLTMSLTPRGTEVADRRGYSIYVAAEPVPNAMYRAWAEIMKDGRRVERSGLVGPRFAAAGEAEQFALDWARQWIDRECRTQNAAQQAVSASEAIVADIGIDLGSESAEAALAHAALPVQALAQTPAQEEEAVATAQPAPELLDVPVVAFDTVAATVPPGVARPLPPIRQVPEPAAANHGAPLPGALQHPLHGPIGGLRGPLRRYPAEPAALPAEEGASGTASSSSSSSSDRYPNYPELISHAG